MLKASVSKCGLIPDIAPLVAESGAPVSLSEENLSSVILPGFCDVHVHFREPGFSYKETIATGSRAAARGGYTEVLAMPNLSPVPDSVENLKPELDAIARGAVVSVRPYGALTVGEKGKEPADLEGLAPFVAAFSDDGKGVQDMGMMREVMTRCAALDKVLAAHCEDESLLHGGYIHAGEYAAAHGHRGICSESEWRPIERDVKLAAETGVKYHVCHISCRESVEIIREAKKSGVGVTCETAPHYLLLDESALCEDGRFKMNPPLRGKADREALLEGVSDGTIDMIATDHAPHSAEEKARGLEKSPFGIVGIETAFPLLYTYLVKKGVIPMERLLEMMITKPRERFGLGLLPEGFSVWDLESEYAIDPAGFLSMGRATPFAGVGVYGKCLMTVYRGKVVYKA
ncbi:MAG: dihydroorotase [Clostridia bacterium]|nr:dihydroorotase [Clostridia bacterium]